MTDRDDPAAQSDPGAAVGRSLDSLIVRAEIRSNDVDPGSEKKAIQTALDAAEADKLKKESGGRSFIMISITVLFILLVVSAIALSVITTYWPPCANSADLVKEVREILQGPVLSVLNLILGYYFGAAARPDRKSL